MGHNKKPNLRIIGVEEGEELQIKGPEDIFNKIIEENFPILKRDIPMKVQEAYRTPNRLDQKKTSPRHIIIKTQSSQIKERILRAAKEKSQVTYKGKPIRLTPDFSIETMKARRSWIEVLQKLRDMDASPDYYTQPSYCPLSMEKTKYSRIKTNLNNT